MLAVEGLPFSDGWIALLKGLPLLSGRLPALILSQSLKVSLYITLVMLPVILLIMRGTALVHLSKRRNRERKKQGDIPVNPWPAKWNIFQRRTPVLALLVLNVLGLILYARHVSELPVDVPVRRVLPEAGQALKVTYEDSVFLARRIIEFTIEARGNPCGFNLFLESDDGEAPRIYSATMPFEFQSEGDGARVAAAFVLGEGPPDPFTWELVLPRDFFGVLRVEVLYTVWDPAVDMLPQPETRDYVLTCGRSIVVGLL
jgi:hypothetical protein